MKKLFLFACLILLISSLALSSLACWPTSTDTTSDAPTIVAFSAAPTEITEGDSATLIWNATNATSIQIDQNVGTGLAAAGTTSVSPTSSTTYTLTASNSAGSATQSVTVTVTEPESTPTTPPAPELTPSIVAFDISPNNIHKPPGPGPYTATMRWVVLNATSVTINGISGPHAGSRTLAPTLGTHTYTLKATNAKGTVTRTQILRVVQ